MPLAKRNRRQAGDNYQPELSIPVVFSNWPSDVRPESVEHRPALPSRGLRFRRLFLSVHFLSERKWTLRRKMIRHYLQTLQFHPTGIWLHGGFSLKLRQYPLVRQCSLWVLQATYLSMILHKTQPGFRTHNAVPKAGQKNRASHAAVSVRHRPAPA